ncbi:RNA polymerase-associated protein LEO1 [Candida albicans L26]|uniref:RNA polymerase-associated protein LEO1 n=3 Tax=Candida albicans TaxID=5476 RepID=A0A1D8PQH1_CANAL|nr:uncharacterized protein CAALFM_C700070CA [Candida albicans SC5314]KAF6069056.1 Leo1-like family protein [Candida albicans]KGR05429.1 RNA polymerase-associated protein LEO1 [Candida albicans P78048]KGT65257.1 RNA polymerase-associated protein LEO1 [Candida albicans 12C]KGU04868.1 RNA polymerase-associated protein LEO1 [Candida albicans 19F]KGU04977.1 RNA polymerase-associated protein LEO1 [Candida albicans L26]KGU21002.1 RNA polymerase-associated protein LEO1 [Candida albicans P34048]|eukprot:XP_720406.1 hypothetical protein CAALFM_C700070CA [Candida albicans SC5314]
MSDEEIDDLFGEETTEKIVDLSLPRHAVVSVMEKDVRLLKTPDFLNIEAHPFDPSSFKEQIESNNKVRRERGLTAKEIHNEQMTEKLLNENTIRWRYHNAGNDEIVKQSNAHFVEWSDGSVSLKVGNEVYDVRELPMFDHLLVKSHQAAEVLQADSILSKSINLLPASSSHRKILVKNITKKEKILNTITDVDPLEKQRLADEDVRKAMKMKRQMESRRRLQEEKWERSGSPRAQESSYERFERTYEGEGYDENDDFVAGDEEEIEEYEEEEEFERGAERLTQLKEEGAAKYRRHSEDEDEDEKTRKRRRIIDSDEE